MLRTIVNRENGAQRKYLQKLNVLGGLWVYLCGCRAFKSTVSKFSYSEFKLTKGTCHMTRVNFYLIVLKLTPDSKPSQQNALAIYHEHKLSSKRSFA